MTRLKMGIAGFDHPHVLRYAPALARHPLVRLEWIADAGPNRHRAKRIAASLGCRFVGADVATGRLPGGVDAVYLANRPGQHLAAVRNLAGAGCHLLCDKPIAWTLEEADEICRVAREAGVHLMVPFNPRFQPGPRHLKERIAGGDLGDLRMVHVVKTGKLPTSLRALHLGWFVDPKEVAFGGFGDIGIHAIDALRWWFGRDPVRVWARIQKGPHPELAVDSLGHAVYEWADGAVATLTAGWSNPAGFPSFLDARFEVVGTRGAARIENPYVNLRISDGRGSEVAAVARPDIDGVVDAFVGSVLADRVPPLTGEDGRAALALTLAAYRAARERQPVEIVDVAGGGA